MSADFNTRVQSLLTMTGGAPSLGPECRPGISPVKELDAALSGIFASSGAAEPSREIIRAIVYLWHDHLSESHAISQNIATAEGSFIHGIMHRREPDYQNAEYWFRRVGQHPIFEKLANVAGQARWDPFAFIDKVETACREHATTEQEQLRSLQASEMTLLLEFSLAGR